MAGESPCPASANNWKQNSDAKTSISSMDSECLVLLPRVCAVLADPTQSLPDDTSLEKLLDWFTGLTKEDHGLTLLESCPCLVDYISTVCLDKTTHPSMLSFSLKLSGLLAASQHGFNLLQVN
ncbi:BRCA1-associated ATM activator 1-like [Salmo trutta]|uniref:BRCA1-associated ATM activator 1-like n=1 Tax=Salmo trutta TaxID=8032 RepID=UPI001130322B|nr:BRCA1-associated ATM activator 1-like [Salmo trutta]